MRNTTRALALALLACADPAVSPRRPQAADDKSDRVARFAAGSPALNSESTESTESIGDSPRPTPNLTCPTVLKARAVWSNGSRQLPEVSGLIASGRQEGLVWLHNDSGDGAQIYAVDPQGRITTLVLRGAKVQDAEDLAMRPNATGPDWLYLADTGDNLRQRKTVAIYRLAEPLVTFDSNASHPMTTDVGHLRLTYDDGPQDVEAVFVDPMDGSIYLIGKGRSGSNPVYAVHEPRFDGTSHVARNVATLQLGLVTAADISRDGRRILVRTYLGVHFFSRDQGQSIAAALRGRACELAVTAELQGEALGWLPTGQGFYTMGERRNLGAVPLYRYRLSDATAPPHRPQVSPSKR